MLYDFKVWSLPLLLFKGRTVMLVLVLLLYCVVLLQMTLKIPSGAFSLGLGGRAPVRQKTAVASCLPCAWVVTCTFTLACENWCFIRHSQADVFSPEVSHKTFSMKNLSTKFPSGWRKVTGKSAFFVLFKNAEVWGNLLILVVQKKN